MARYVLVEFDNDVEAEAFVNKIIQRNLDLASRKREGRYRIKGYFAKPTKFCECGPLTDRQQREETTRGAKYGWMVHIPCRRARPMSQSPRNLLDPEDTHPRMRDAFLHLVGDWDKKYTRGNPIPNYPIAVNPR